MSNAISQIEVPGVRKVKSGKVREIFDLGDALLVVATDRLSAFDVVLPDPIPDKGRVLTALSAFWFGRTAHLTRNHLLTCDDAAIAARVGPVPELAGRAMLVRKCRPLPMECVVRGYLAGSGWKEYRERQSVCGIALPPGLLEAGELPEPIFTPATKAESGHDLNIDFATAARLVGAECAEQVRTLSVALYRWAADYARQRGIIIADTKFEFGLAEGRLWLIDEALTPDSSRFWPVDSYRPGRAPPSFDKQYVRDYLESIAWDKRPPAPRLPAEVIAQTTQKYREALRRLTG